MSDHALTVSNQAVNLEAKNFAAIEAVLSLGEISLTANDLTQLKALFSQQASATKANLVNDTRALIAGDVFCAVIGSLRDGREYIAQALAENCAMILQETTESSEHGQLTWCQQASGNAIPLLSYYQLNHELFELAKAFYNAPQQYLNVIGITGTNGKTSTSQIIANLLDACQKNCAVIGTNGAGKLAHLKTIENTTPSATELHQLLALFVEEKITDVAMEVSSHALAQKRVSASLFNTAVFTNLSRDHLDYHQTMTEYAAAKRAIFTCDSKQVAVINGDDPQAQSWLAHWPKLQPVVLYGRGKNIANCPRFAQALNVEHHTKGVSFTLNTEQGQVEIRSQLLGDFNVENLLAAIAVLMVENIALTTIASAIRQLVPIMGRMEAFSSVGKATTVVDYAHTPDALSSALDACRLHCHGKLWLVFGCGGDRDVGKRALMAKVAESKADHIIITNDNPRSEDPEAIAADIIAGLGKTARFEKILDRKTAVLMTLKQADTDDVILCAGKGHEDYIIFGNEKRHYDERAIVKAFYSLEKELTL
ncbi:UDP-N-acetylmuramoyl-L-alanyl-D-glutamate--2,6-diaminopimelate ligase [Colwellia sp. MB02u-10]|uniref:UDP-N-acetylmuramoyl-L-alanyl-D-glutamate--2, 6-diaminopimelate ligase n=1 Tax=Colwellia sp. MB02u-10 TaxID=2759828 RepID=UPI0015F6C7D7|nr:UDP-N-acetylmuramoyl-L-alanyl-D-glutamate--2,6-diaminopimelate ligase [Colwellia sp. MB02u-10]MBA6342363.1 UDP-N-acetylmuramoyl-L-alanyl-D-glutamate--2,6-diaminopimelate ligase [Colwellia sp. MB02u-10]